MQVTPIYRGLKRSNTQLRNARTSRLVQLRSSAASERSIYMCTVPISDCVCTNKLRQTRHRDACSRQPLSTHANMQSLGVILRGALTEHGL